MQENNGNNVTALDRCSCGKLKSPLWAVCTACDIAHYEYLCQTAEQDPPEEMEHTP